jgi:hypothetical protein
MKLTPKQAADQGVEIDHRGSTIPVPPPQTPPTPLEIIKDAFTRAGVEFNIASYKDGEGVEWSYLFRGHRYREEVLAANGDDDAISRLTQLHDFMEFENGQLASY